jgi:hypothetical protein
VTTETRDYSWADLAAAIGQDFSGGAVDPAIDQIERSLIRRYCEPLEMDCPLFYDDEVARQHGYRGVFAPFSGLRYFAYPALWRPGDPTRYPNAEPDDFAAGRRHQAPRPRAPGVPMPKTTAFFITDIEVEYHGEAYVGDRLSVRGRKLVSVTPKRTSVGDGAFVVWQHEIINQNGELIATLKAGGFHYNPAQPSADAAGGA